MKLGGGGRFAKLEKEVANEYEKKGMSHEEAMHIGAATAAKQGMMRYGKERMQEMAMSGKKKKRPMRYKNMA